MNRAEVSRPLQVALLVHGARGEGLPLLVVVGRVGRSQLRPGAAQREQSAWVPLSARRLLLLGRCQGPLPGGLRLSPSLQPRPPSFLKGAHADISEAALLTVRP